MKIPRTHRLAAAVLAAGLTLSITPAYAAPTSITAMSAVQSVAELEIESTTEPENRVHSAAEATFKIQTTKGDVGDPVIVWSVDGEPVEGQSGTSFTTPDAAFDTISVTVSIDDGVADLTRTLEWGYLLREPHGVALAYLQVDGLEPWDAHYAAIREGLEWLATGTVLSYDAPADEDAEGFEISYQWHKNGEPIEGATNLSYTLAQGDRDAAIQLQVISTRAGYKESLQISTDLVGALLGEFERDLPGLSASDSTWEITPGGGSLQGTCDEENGIFVQWKPWSVAGIAVTYLERVESFNFFSEEDTACSPVVTPEPKPKPAVPPKPPIEPEPIVISDPPIKPAPKPPKRDATPQVMTTLSAAQLEAISGE